MSRRYLWVVETDDGDGWQPSEHVYRTRKDGRERGGYDSAHTSSGSWRLVKYEAVKEPMDWTP